jgi:hypothetical protein
MLKVYVNSASVCVYNGDMYNSLKEGTKIGIGFTKFKDI